MLPTKTAKTNAALILRFIPRWRTIFTIIAVLVSFCLGGVCGIIVERKETRRLQALFFTKQQKLQAKAEKAAAPCQNTSTPAGDTEEWEDVDVSNQGASAPMSSSFAEFNIEWSKYTEDKRVNSMLQDAHVAFLSHTGLDLQGVMESFGSHSLEAGIAVKDVELGILGLEIPGIDAKTARTIAESVDCDHTGIVTMQNWLARFEEADRVLRLEYLSWVRDILQQSFPSVASAFQAFDSDGDEMLSALDFAAALDSMAEITEDDMGKILWSLGVRGGIEQGVLHYRDFVEAFPAAGRRA